MSVHKLLHQHYNSWVLVERMFLDAFQNVTEFQLLLFFQKNFTLGFIADTMSICFKSIGINQEKEQFFSRYNSSMSKLDTAVVEQHESYSW